MRMLYSPQHQMHLEPLTLPLSLLQHYVFRVEDRIFTQKNPTHPEIAGREKDAAAVQQLECGWSTAD